MKNKAIGLIDSGVGGLTILKELEKILPNERFYFYADLKNAPYGEKSINEIQKYCLKSANFLLKKGIKALVIACNTATAAALDYLESKLNIPIIGVINAGAIKGLATTKNNKILVLGTKLTIDTNLYEKELFKFNKKIKVYNKSCRSFASFIESGEYINLNKTKLIIEKELLDTKKLDFDTVILGCTHYPIIKNQIIEFYENKVNVVSGAKLVGMQLLEVLRNLNILTEKNNKKDIFFISKKSFEFEKTAQTWLNRKNICIEVVKL